MKKIFYSLLLIFSLFALPNLSSAYTETVFADDIVCEVADPSGTPLNVRSRPSKKGKVVAKLENGTEVRFENSDPSATWWEISVKRSGKWKRLGWVYREYLRCEE